MLVRTPCPRYHEAVDEVLASDEVQKVLKENAQLFQELTEHTGMPIKTPDDIQSLYSTLRAEMEYGLKLPKWTQAYYPDKLTNLTDWSYIYNIYTDEMKQLKAGPFIEKLVTEFKNKRDGKLKPKDLKINLYTGHDSSVVNMLSALNVWPKQFPTYGIMGECWTQKFMDTKSFTNVFPRPIVGMFEMVRDKKTGELGVQIYLRNSATSGAIPLTIPGCDHFCPLEKFIEIASRVIPKDREAACKPHDK